MVGRMIHKNIVPPSLEGKELLLHLRTISADEIGNNCIRVDHNGLTKFIVRIKDAIDSINTECLSESGCRKSPEKKSLWRKVVELSPDRFIFFINGVISIVLTIIGLRNRKK